MTGLRVLKGAGAQFDSHRWGAGESTVKTTTPEPGTHLAPLPPAACTEAEKDAARREGFEAGEAAARARFDGQIQQMSRELAGAVQGIVQLRTQVIFDARSDLLQLSLQIARRVIHREVTVAPDVLAGIVRVLLETLAARDVFRIRLHPSQYQVVESELHRCSRDGATPALVADASLPPGGCVVETISGEIDAGIDAQLGEIDRGLTDMLGAA
jgi:flagellar assembly protein FliH